MAKKLLHGFLVGLAAAAIAAGCRYAGWLASPENMFWQWRVRAFAARTPPSERIQVILLDQNSLGWGRTENRWSWPWPREVFGALVDYLAAGGAQIVAFDMLFAEPDLDDGQSDAEFARAAAMSTP